MTNAYMQEGLDAFKSGQVAMQMNWFAFFPGLYKEMGPSKIGFFVNPGATVHYTQLGGQGISVVSYSEHKDDALQYLKWFAQPDVQKKWWSLGGYSCLKAVLDDPGFKKSAPFAGDFLESMNMVKDFWAEPIYATLLLADKGTAKQALDSLVKDWTRDFKEAGKSL
jgi:multiple sugar transport system substrate-binding protein